MRGGKRSRREAFGSEEYTQRKMRRRQDGSSMELEQRSQPNPRRIRIPKNLQGFVRTEGNWGNVEKKWFDTAIAFDFDDTGEVPASGQLTLIPQGVTQSTRIGSKCDITNLYFRGGITWNTVTATNSRVRLMIVMDTQCNGAAATWSDVLVNDTNIYSFNNLTNSQRFRILKDWIIMQPLGMYDSTGTVKIAPQTYLEFYKKFKEPVPVVYNSTTGAITEIRSNNFFLLAASDVSDDGNSFLGSCRLRFTDK